MNELESDQERRLRRRRERRERLSSGMTTLLFILGSALNLLGLILLVGNIANLSRLWLTGQPVALGSEQLAPFGAFLAGVICFVIAFTID